MATTFDLLNKVLIGLRKSKLDTGTTEITDPYHLLLLQYINIAKNEVEGAWDWHQLRDTITVTTELGDDEYSLLATEQSNTDVPGNSRLLYVRLDTWGFSESTTKYAHSLPQVFDTTDGPPSRRLIEAGREQMHTFHEADNNQTGDPIFFSVRPSDDDTKLRLFPEPADVRTIQMRFVIPQAELAADDLTTALSVPAYPVWLKALYYANQERGEELGRPGSTLEAQAHEALALAIAAERTDVDNTSYPQ